MTDEECGKQLWLPAFQRLLENSNDCCSIYVTMPQGGTHMMMMMMMMMMMHEAGWQVKHELIWVKNSPTFSMGRLDYDYQHEPILYGWKNKHKFPGKGQMPAVWLAQSLPALPTKQKINSTAITLMCCWAWNGWTLWTAEHASVVPV